MSGQWGTSFTEIRGLGRAAVVLAVVWTGLLLVSAMTVPPSNDGLLVPEHPGLPIYLLATALGLLVTVANWLVVAAVLNTARRNAIALDPHSQRRSAAWVWLGWVLPAVNLWFPYQVVRDIHRTTSHGARGTAEPSGLLGSWWVTWLLVVGAVQINTRLSLRDITGTTLVVSEWAVAIMALVALPFWIRVLRDLVGVQDSLANRPWTGAGTLLPHVDPAVTPSPYPYGIPPAGAAPYGAPSPQPGGEPQVPRGWS